MKTVAGVGLAIAMGALICSAQDNRVPFRQIEQDAQLSARLEVPPMELPVSSSVGSAGSSSVSGYVFVPPSMKARRTASTGFFVANGLHLGLAALDVAMTQHCIAAHRCREGNPIMPSSLGGQLGVDAVLVSFGAFSSYRLKKNGSGAWWLSPVVGAGSHAAGVVTGLAHY
jgi:hypothetical protein